MKTMKRILYMFPVEVTLDRRYQVCLESIACVTPHIVKLLCVANLKGIDNDKTFYYIIDNSHPYCPGFVFP
jgi:hypothetical protein